jgi:glucose-6-phosphate dehydrogenase assembly protein OpcA
MEDAVSESLIESGTSLDFAGIQAALARNNRAPASNGAPARALTATVVAIGPRARLEVAVEPLRQLGRTGAIRGILIPQGESQGGGGRVSSNVVAIDGLEDAFIDNAVAALRLSSLPTVIWWRGGPAGLLDKLVGLADRVVLDTDPPEPGWQCAVEWCERTAFGDVRWTRLTRWRSLMAQFFDIPEVRAGAASFDRLVIAGADAGAAQLFAAWLRTALHWGDGVTVDIQGSDRKAPIERIALSGGGLELNLRLAKSPHCVESAAKMGEAATSRVVSLGDDSIVAVLTEELRIRSRDEALERALRAIVGAA